MSHESVFTCVTCNVAFNAFELQRDHYKTDWHRYNLKRKIAELPSVSHKEFQERLSIQKAQNENAQNPSQEEMFCTLCSKHFNTANAFTNHLNSKKHKELVDASAKSNEDKSFAVKGDRNAKKAEQAQKEADEAAAAEEALEVEEEVDEKDWEDVDEEDIDSIDESQGIDVQNCLFCPHKASSAEAKCEHMAREHSFFIPDMDHVSDVEGLLRFLGVKVGAYHVCLWCSSKCYRTLDAVQKHMSDKGHQKMRFEGETLLEYADFYEYEDDEDDSLDKTDGSYDVADDFDIKTISRISSSFREDVENGDSQGDVSYELVLPSGAKIGHRSLFKYYKQSFGHRNLELKKKSNLSVKDKYKAIAYGQSYSVTEIQKQRKDLAYFQRWSAKMSAKLGWETNKLQKHFRRQDICF